MNKYSKITTKYIEEIQSEITIYKHNKTNARICTIANDDNNKVFSIAFRTPPMDSTGLTHILEHSVLCGSKNYPVKDPFVELLKGSLNTFLNAFTFPDKTMYPCASQNLKDFKNLMSIYMDAVFYPQIYNHEEIFRQEGWHYHLTSLEEPITYNGVVYNEMKGAFSDPQQILYRNLMHSLFPDTPYGFESGGDPAYIPDLTYEQFKNFHSQYYHPSNSYIFIYGNCDMEERMNWLDEAYLSKFEQNDFDTKIQYQEPFTKPHYQTDYYPLDESLPLEHKTFLSYNVAFPSTLDTKLIMATGILVDVLFNTPGAPLKQALIDAKIGDDIQASFDDGILQPLLAIVAVNSDESKQEKFINIINTELEKIVKNGLDHSAIESLINFQEFKTKEAKFGSMPRGLEIQLSCLASWLYSEDLPFAKVEIFNLFDELRSDLKNGYFEEIIVKYILNNSHKSFVNLVPSHSLASEKEANLEKKLKHYKDSLTTEELENLINKNKELSIYQSTPSTAEEIATLPKLALEDLNLEPEKYNCELIKNNYEVLHSDYFTNDINYVGYSFDMSKASIKTIQYAQLLADLLTNISTTNHSYKELNQMIQNYTGGVTFSVNTIKKLNQENYTEFKVSYSALTKNLASANDLIIDIILNSNFKDEKRLLERMNEINVNMQMSIANRGHVVGLQRALSYFDVTGYIVDNTNGVGYLDFISDLCKNFNHQEIINELKAVCIKVFTKKKFKLRFTASKDALNNYYQYADAFYNVLNNDDEQFNYSYDLKALNEGFKTQYDVNFVSLVGSYEGEFKGAMHVLNNALSLDYLWMEVRVHGGAYGCMLSTPVTKSIGFTSYRDPNILKTFDVYKKVIEYVKNFNPNEEQLLQYKIGAIGSLDLVLHPSVKGLKAQTLYIQGYDYELQLKHRKEAIEATKEDVVSLASLFAEALNCDNLCVIGNSTKIENNANLFKNIRNLIK